MSKKKKKNTFKRPPTDVMTHGVLWLVLSVAFFILNYYGQSVLGYTLTDPQIFQFIIAPIIWAIGLGLHAYTHQLLNRSFIPFNVTRSLRHKVRDIHIGLFIAFFMMLFSMGLTASIVGTGDLDVISTLILLIPWLVVVGLHSWIVRFIDQRTSKGQRNADAEGDIDISRLVDGHDESKQTASDEVKKADYQTT